MKPHSRSQYDPLSKGPRWAGSFMQSITRLKVSCVRNRKSVPQFIGRSSSMRYTGTWMWKGTGSRSATTLRYSLTSSSCSASRHGGVCGLDIGRTLKQWLARGARGARGVRGARGRSLTKISSSSSAAALPAVDAAIVPCTLHATSKARLQRSSARDIAC